MLFRSKNLWSVLYGGAPMYRIYGNDVRNYAEEIRRTQRYVNEWVRQIAFDEMTNHRFVTPDRLVQETEFAGGRGVVVNCGDADFTLPDGQAVAARDYVSFCVEDGRRIYTPPPCPNVFAATKPAAAVPPAPPTGGPRRPNVLVMLADDAGYGDFSLVGNTNLSTPAIDSLARDGGLLQQFMVQPFCSPTRAEFLTGRCHPRTGVRGVTTGQERMAAGERTIAEDFRDAGYATGCFGKWHNGTQWPWHPRARGFDTFYGFTEGHWGDYIDPPLEHDEIGRAHV